MKFLMYTICGLVYVYYMWYGCFKVYGRHLDLLYPGGFFICSALFRDLQSHSLISLGVGNFK